MTCKFAVHLVACATMSAVAAYLTAACSDQGEVDQTRGNAAAAHLRPPELHPGDQPGALDGGTPSENPWAKRTCDVNAMDSKYALCNACICKECNDYTGDIAGQGQMGDTHALYFATECMSDSLCPQILDCAQKTHCDGTTCPMKGESGCGDIILPHATERGAGLAWSIGSDCLAPGIRCVNECGKPPSDAGR